MPTPARERAMTRSTVAAVAAAASALIAGCGSYTTYQTAEPLPRGRWQGAAAIGPGVFVDQPGASRTPSVHVELAARRGVGADTDAGVKLYGLGWEAGVRHRITRRGAWSLAPLLAIGGLRTIGRGSLPDALAGHLRLTGIATRRTSSRWAWSFGPVVTGSLYLPAAGGHATGVLVGVVGNGAWRFGRCWQLVPELSLHRSVAGDVPVDGSVVQLGVGVLRDF
jgi:hypothetical protein